MEKITDGNIATNLLIQEGTPLKLAGWQENKRIRHSLVISFLFLLALIIIRSTSAILWLK